MNRRSNAGSGLRVGRSRSPTLAIDRSGTCRNAPVVLSIRLQDSTLVSMLVSLYLVGSIVTCQLLHWAIWRSTCWRRPWNRPAEERGHRRGHTRCFLLHQGLRYHLTCSVCGARHQKTEGEALREAFALALRLESGEGVFRRRLKSARRASARCTRNLSSFHGRLDSSSPMYCSSSWLRRVGLRSTAVESGVDMGSEDVRR